jgi:hypothetical protein
MAKGAADFIVLLALQRLLGFVILCIAVYISLRTVGAHEPAWRTLCRWGALAAYAGWVLTDLWSLIGRTTRHDTAWQHWHQGFAAAGILLAFVGRGREGILIVGATVLLPFLLWIRF